MNKLTIFSDGGSRGNPGPAAIGYVIFNQNNLIHKEGKRIGEATNNVAEYMGVVEALRWIKNNREELPENYKNKEHPLYIDFYLDSNLVVNQLSGKFKIKKQHLFELVKEVDGITKELNATIMYSHIPREKNAEADQLLNDALDSR
ncbi:ribonuclease HI family protein [Patescibacteria group bacterium]